MSTMDTEEYNKVSSYSSRSSTEDVTSQTDQYSLKKRKGSEWEILDNLQQTDFFPRRHKRIEGFMTKRRNWPLRGWHKRYFELENGILRYGKSATSVSNGRTHGKIDLSFAVMSVEYKTCRIDIDNGDQIYHLKLSNVESFGIWLEQLKQHKLYRQTLVSSSGIDSESVANGIKLTQPPSENEILAVPPVSSSSVDIDQGQDSKEAFNRMDNEVTKQLLNLQRKALEMSMFIQNLEDERYFTMPTVGSGGHYKKKLFHLRKKKSPKPPDFLDEKIKEPLGLHVSMRNTNLDPSDSISMCSSSSPTRPTSLPVVGNISMETSSAFLSEEVGQPFGFVENIGFMIRGLQSQVSELLQSYSLERQRLMSILSESEKEGLSCKSASCKRSLEQALAENRNLVARLKSINRESDLSDMRLANTVVSDVFSETLCRPRRMNPSNTFRSQCSAEYFDAREFSSSPDTDEDESDGDQVSNDSDELLSCTENENLDDSKESKSQEPYSASPSSTAKRSSLRLNRVKTLTHLTGRRQKLPCAQPAERGTSIVKFLYRNIGMDLSKVCMPVELNEPLSLLQRLCEELEYSELLDKAVAPDNTPAQRIMWIAAFAISAYGSSNARVAHKPFNPLLGETFECIREDHDFRYIAEQVSHHPPVSACYAESLNRVSSSQRPRWTWTQDLRLKSKFFGKSMEFISEGKTVVCLSLNDGSTLEYTWNKVTSCIRNLFGPKRWLDLYGKCEISCSNPKGNSCTIDFVPASYWSNQHHEINGKIKDASGQVIECMFGLWSEAVYCGNPGSAKCIWRPGNLPDDSKEFYDFSRFAIQLNEPPSEELAKLLPPTDSRLRPDIRLLENGLLKEAEVAKHHLEQMQRQRRHLIESGVEQWPMPMWFTCTDENASSSKWTFSQKYWLTRDSTDGFKKSGLKFIELW